MKTWTDRIVDMVFRGVAGLVVIYILQRLCLHQGLPVLAGINFGTFLLVAILGMPGFLLVFAASLIYFY
ncbi:MAG: pro-sigmaK processing inhibitor BofA family protein [Lachnospiraceae bacterium]|nr:pro-sigmaK processing inhibitor BofA family protein [Lachnospiraceae bacterium]MBP3611346.1 pro-sigmaK processing inhibitor BofA family protein [Lachnospiraceae bacterium]